MPDFDVQHKKNAYSYAAKMEKVYLDFSRKIALIANDPKARFQKSFKFSNNKEIQKKVDKLTGEFNAQLYDIIHAGIKAEWELANTKNDQIVQSTIKSAEVLSIDPGITDRNVDALKAFVDRKVDGLNLSDRVWAQASAFRDELEMHLQLGILNGDSANLISRRIRENLDDPYRLFRRVRDKEGNLVLSQAARNFHPGQGVYRSSYRNARRLAVTETNMAYRRADHLRWKNNPTIVGFEVKLSGSHPAIDICDHLKGKYPKSFVFTGWHPQCFCYAVPIQISDEEFDKYLDSIIEGKEYDPSGSLITKTPEGFNNWMKDNSSRLDQMKKDGKLPYFVRDNFKDLNFGAGQKFEGIKSNEADNIDFESKKIKQKISAKRPVEFMPDSDYLKNESFDLKDEFFDLLDSNKDLKIRFSTRDGSYNQAELVQIGRGPRSVKSAAYRERIIYHEVGHAIDSQRGLRYSAQVNELMDKHKTLLRKKTTASLWTREYDFKTGKYTNKKIDVGAMKIAIASKKLDQLHEKIRLMSDATFAKRGITKSDVLDKIGSTQDTIMSLNPSYGWGHTKSYFKTYGMSQAEFLAHAFENTFAGNQVFKKYLPELYDDMIEYIKSLK